MNDTKERDIPTCIGVIMDGNRRWAREKGLETKDGHYRGAEVFEEIAQWAVERQLPHLVLYAFSTENWKRSKMEVNYLMKLFAKWITRLEERFVSDPVTGAKMRFRFIGQREDFPKGLQDAIMSIETKSASHEGTTIWIALSYGGRAEIVSAVNAAIAKGESVDEARLRSYMWSAGMPDPDFVVRTGGEQRLSNFLPWQSVYSELFFVEKYWPDVTPADFDDLVAAYTSRKRRFGV